MGDLVFAGKPARIATVRETRNAIMFGRLLHRADGMAYYEHKGVVFVVGDQDARGDASSFLAGFAAGLAELNRMHDQPSMVCDVLRGYGVKLLDLSNAGVEEYDLGEIAKCLRQGNADDRLQVTPAGSRPAKLEHKG